ncbi:helix-turn-helix domain-containing protein [Streptomyces sp. NPDC057280]|uniref:helix-turn-helix domain-containing protein n=1 Tax=Streptomyces sp. NPDC057280 TaxID=3346081 RepID=UPI0036451D46
MHDEPDRRSPAHAELCNRLDSGRAHARLDQTQLAGRAGLGRTTVSKALSPRGGVPSVDTVTALADVLKLPVGELLELRRAAAEEAGMVAADVTGPGRPIGQWDPHELEVHPAGPGKTRTDGVLPLPGYVRRQHDQILANAVAAAARGRSGIVVLVGTSSTGKTRACWEAVQPLREMEKGWRLWHPFDPTRAEAALDDLHRVGPRTVVWLNEAQHYLGDPKFGERIAAAVHHLLIDEERAPVLVLGTLWPGYIQEYTALPATGGADQYSRVRELLVGHTVSVPETFDTMALDAATEFAEDGDRLLADALTRARTSGRVTQDLAGAPELLARYEQASPAARAVLNAAMDARRLGVDLHLPQAFLTDAATDYLSDIDYDQLTDDWAEQAFAELATPVHGKQAPLRRTNPRPLRRPPAPTGRPILSPPPTRSLVRLADYLEEHGRGARRHLCPPSSFWQAAYTHLSHPDDLENLTRAAQDRHRLQWAHHLLHRAAHHGSTNALHSLALQREEAGDHEGAELLARKLADHGDTNALHALAMLREEAGDRGSAELLLQQAVDRGSVDSLYRLAELRARIGDRDGAELILQQAVDQGLSAALYRLAEQRKQAGDLDGAELILRQAVDQGLSAALYRLAEMREQAGDRDGAELLARQAAMEGEADALIRLADLRKRAGDRDSAELLLQQAVDQGLSAALYRLAEMREEAGDRDGAELLARQAAANGDTTPLYRLAVSRQVAEDWDGAELLLQQAADHGDTAALNRLAQLREADGDRDAAELLLQQGANGGSIGGLYILALLREEAGDWDGAAQLLQQAADHGDTLALYHLAQLREQAGDQEGAELLALQAADHGDAPRLNRLPARLLNRLWPYGLDPDGRPTPPWSRSSRTHY